MKSTIFSTINMYTNIRPESIKNSTSEKGKFLKVISYIFLFITVQSGDIGFISVASIIEQ